ncbi:MAG: hypothetical protein ACJAYC_000866 [Halieaceae bacterium]|jgi:hypothetical protein
MSTQKSVFGTKDPTPPKFEAEECHTKKYMGPERRHDDRRRGHDRRLEIRFEVSAEDRRHGHGRRKSDNAPTFW